MLFFFSWIFSLPWMLSTASSSAVPLYARGGSLSLWLVLLTWQGLPTLQWRPLCCLPLLSCGWEGASAEALVLLTSLRPFPEPGWGCRGTHHPRSPQVSSARAGGTHFTIRSLQWGFLTLRWRWNLWGRWDCGCCSCWTSVPAGGITAVPADPSTDKPKQGGERLQEVQFPKPFLFNSRSFSKMSQYSASTRTRIKVSCTRRYLSSLIFWMMMVLLI